MPELITPGVGVHDSFLEAMAEFQAEGRGGPADNTMIGAEIREFAAFRHELTPRLREVGGHIGYDVRPSARRNGHATAMLRAMLPVARSIGIENVLITCDFTNIASRKVIESCGGELEAERDGVLRFWASTTVASIE